MAIRPEVLAALRERAKRRRARASTPPKVRPPTFPKGAEIRYVRALAGYVRMIAAEVRREILPLLDYDGDGVANAMRLGEITRAWTRVGEAIAKYTPGAEKAARDMVRDVTQKNLESMNSAYMSAIGAAPFRATAGLALGRTDAVRQDAPTSVEQVLSNRLQDNVTLITSIAPTMLSQVQDVISEGVRGGLRVEDLSKQIQERFEVAESRANLIARDQVGKLQAQLTEARNRELGVTEYIWQVTGGPSGDGRVRDTHLDLHGTRHRYDDPPVTNDQGDTNNPGEDYQCRCTAQPVLEDVLTALGV